MLDLIQGQQAAQPACSFVNIPNTMKENSDVDSATSKQVEQFSVEPQPAIQRYISHIFRVLQAKLLLLLLLLLLRVQRSQVL